MVTATVSAPMDNKEAYSKLCSKLRELSALEGLEGLLGWDEMVMMPEGASASRGAQKAALAGVLHDKRTDPELGTLLSALKLASLSKDAASPGANGMDEVALAVVRNAHKDYVRATAVPKELAQRMARLESESYAAWVEARKSADFSKFAPLLQQWVDAAREKARCIDPNAPPYDVLLETFEKGLTSARLDQVFAEVREGLVPLIAAIRAKVAQGGSGVPTDTILEGSYDVKKQAELCKRIALDMGFSLTHGRLDVSVHPFTGGTHPQDVRMTTRFKENDIMEGITGAVHETGHALYEQGRNCGPEREGLPVNAALSTAIHESQSLLWERMVALGTPFAHYLLPLLKESFPGSPLSSLTPEQLHAAINVVKEKSYIRVEADEVTYPMHVILRYEIERGLVEGSVSVADVPRLWNDKMQQYLGVTPPDDAKGCLQDIHWTAGAFGYFPTYTLGAMYATQLYNHVATQIPGLDEQLAAGNFKPLKEWLNTHVHQVGSLPASGDELMVQVTGSPLQPSVFLHYLKDKYTKLYNL